MRPADKWCGGVGEREQERHQTLGGVCGPQPHPHRRSLQARLAGRASGERARRRASAGRLPPRPVSQTGGRQKKKKIKQECQREVGWGEIGGPPLARARAPRRLLGTVVVGRRRGRAPAPAPLAAGVARSQRRGGELEPHPRTHGLWWRQESGGWEGAGAAWVARACPPPHLRVRPQTPTCG